MVWKEFRELAAMQGSLKGGLIRYGITFGIMGIYLPMNFGRSLVEMPYFLFIYVWTTMFMGIGIVLDSFAGERERHTLKTLLASRLADRSILYGKIIAAVLYGFGMTLVLIVLGLVTVNVAFWKRQISVFPPEIFAFALVAALLVNVFFTALGVLVSLRAPTVRQGSETLMVAIIAIAVVPIVLFFLVPDEWKTKLLDAIVSAGLVNLGIGVIAVLIAMCAVALYVATLQVQARQADTGLNGREPSTNLRACSSQVPSGPDHDQKHLISRDRLEGMRLAARHDDELTCLHPLRLPLDGDLRFAVEDDDGRVERGDVLA